MTPNAAPTESPADTLDADLRDVNPKFPKAAAGFVLLSGALGVLTAIQILTTVRIFSALWALTPYVLLPLGAALVVLARFVFVARPWAAVASIGVGLVLAMTSGAWLVFAAANGFISLYVIWTPVWALLSVALSGAALTPSLRAERAREKMRAQGMSLGL